MGCINSVPEQVSDSSRKSKRSYPVRHSLLEGDGTRKILNELSPLVSLDHSSEVKEFEVSGTKKVFDLSYCYVSQRGYYPKSRNKANQDSYLVCEKLMGDKNIHLFGVFDGHGEVGDICSHYCADQLPEHFAREINAQGVNIEGIKYEKLAKAYNNCFVQTNTAMHKSEINDTYSGTTGVGVLVIGDKLICANVGDSRAIIASSDSNGQLIYSPLSNDQTPYRKDERERLKKKGATIMTIDQIEGNEPIHENWGMELGNELDENGDPPRVWDKTLEKPGCAFTRSLGDSCAEKCGVCAEPETCEWELTEDDKFVIIASDGVFEFITSQAAVDMIAKFDGSPLDAAKHVVAEAYRLWLTFDDRTDDITIIIIGFGSVRNQGVTHPTRTPLDQNRVRAGSTTDNLDASLHLSPTKPSLPSQDGALPTNAAGSSDKLSSLGAIIERQDSIGQESRKNSSTIGTVNRPVRSKTNAKRRVIIEDFNAASEMFDFDSVVDTKSKEDTKRILTMLKENFLFSSLQPSQQDQVCKAIVGHTVESGEMVIKEGDTGDKLYLVDEGEYLVTKRTETGDEQAIFNYTHPGTAFGELSLMYGKPRGASVMSQTSGKLWTIERSAFRSVIMAGREEGGLVKILQGIPVLNELGMQQLHHLCVNSTTKTFPKGAVIHEADFADWMLCVVLRGRVTMHPMQKDREPSPSVIKVQPKQKKQHRLEMCYVVAEEIGSRFGSVVSDDEEGRASDVLFIPCEMFAEVLGSEGENRLKKEAAKEKMKGKRLTSGLRLPAYEDDALTALPRLESADKEAFTLEHSIAALGEFATVGIYTLLPGGSTMSPTLHNCIGGNGEEQRCSIKVVAKDHANKIKGMPEAQLRERHILASLAHVSTVGKESCLPEALCTFQNAKVTYLVFKDVFTCDLSTALLSKSVPETSMACAMACIYSALRTVHAHGIQHRFVNSTAVYVNAIGVPMLADFRYAKVMDGRKNFTICGDPLYFAPELVGQLGYDYGADLWALGVLYYEAYEGVQPFGTQDNDETEVFNAITSFTSSTELPFKHTPTAMQDLIRRLLNPIQKTRAGYEKANDITAHHAFSGLQWSDLGSGKQLTPVGVQPSAEVMFMRTFQEGALQWDESTITEFSNAVFDIF